MARAGSRSAQKPSKGAAADKAAWLAAMRWRRALERELDAVNLTFTEWLVLDAAKELIRESGDAITQNAISPRTELDKMTISHVMRKLEKRGLVDRAPAFGRPALRVLLTPKGKRTLAEAGQRVDAASKR